MRHILDKQEILINSVLEMVHEDQEYKLLTVKTNPDMMKEFKTLCKKHYLNKSVVIRHLIKYFLDNFEKENDINKANTDNYIDN